MFNWTPLHYASMNGHLSVVECLINQKADINAIDSYGKVFKKNTPLFIMLL